MISSLQPYIQSAKQSAVSLYKALTPTATKVALLQTARFLGAPLIPVIRHFNPKIAPISLTLVICSTLFWATLLATPFAYPHIKGNVQVYRVKLLEKKSETAFRDSLEAAKLLGVDFRFAGYDSLESALKLIGK